MNDAVVPGTQWYVYIIRTRCALFYTGITTDVERRFQEHCAVFNGNVKARGAKYFRGREPAAVVYRETCCSRQAASRREYAIKQLTKQQKQHLIATGSEQTP